MSKYAFTLFILFCALFVASISAYFSITGLAAAFAGAYYSIILMAIAMETSKIAIASLIYTYRKGLNFIAKTFFISVLIALIGISSIGVYAFLSASYEAQAYRMNISQTEMANLERDERFYDRDLERVDIELDRVETRIDDLQLIGSREIEVRDTTTATGVRRTIATAEFRAAQQRIEEETVRRDELRSQRSVILDSLRSIRGQIAEVRETDDSVEHLGPLIFVARVFDVSMDKVMNILTLVITAVLDPIAVALIIAANFTAERARSRGVPTEEPKPKRKWFSRKKKVEEPEPEPVKPEEPEPEPVVPVRHEREPEQPVKERKQTVSPVMEGEVKPEEPKPKNKHLESMTDEELLKVLKRDKRERPVCLFGGSNIDGYDTDGDGLIDRWTPLHSQRARQIKGKKPYYAEKGFDWADRKKWVHDQNAINYWLTYIKGDRYPTDFTSKKY